MGFILSVDEFAPYYEEALPARTDWLENLIGRAERRLEQLVPGVTAAVASGTVALEAAQDVIAAAVLRVLRNPSGATTQTRTTGPYTRSDTWQSPPGEDDEIWFTSRELAGLAPGTTGDAFEVVLR